MEAAGPGRDGRDGRGLPELEKNTNGELAGAGKDDGSGGGEEGAYRR